MARRSASRSAPGQSATCRISSVVTDPWVGNLHVMPPYQRRGVGTWLLGQATGWLRLAEVSRLLTYAWLEGTDPGGLNYCC